MDVLFEKKDAASKTYFFKENGKIMMKNFLSLTDGIEILHGCIFDGLKKPHYTLVLDLFMNICKKNGLGTSTHHFISAFWRGSAEKNKAMNLTAQEAYKVWCDAFAGCMIKPSKKSRKVLESFLDMTAERIDCTMYRDHDLRNKLATYLDGVVDVLFISAVIGTEYKNLLGDMFFLLADRFMNTVVEDSLGLEDILKNALIPQTTLVLTENEYTLINSFSIEKRFALNGTQRGPTNTKLIIWGYIQFAKNVHVRSIDIVFPVEMSDSNESRGPMVVSP